MNNFFKKLSIKWKLLTLLIFSSLFAWLLTAVFLVGFEISEVKNDVENDIKSVSSLISNRTTAALLFQDRKIAQENLQALKKFSSITTACIYNKAGKLFSAMEENTNNACPLKYIKNYTHFDKNELFVYQKISLKGEIIGILYIHADLTQEIDRKYYYIRLTLVWLFVALAISFFLSIPFLKNILDPFATLVKTVNKISHKKDYSFRAAKTYDDELGHLVDAFNKMIATLEQQNLSITAAKNRYFALYNNNPTMVFNLTLEGIIDSVNHFGAKQLYSTAEELQGRSVFDFIHPEDKGTTKDMLKRCELYSQQVHKQEIRKICQNKIIWVRETAHLVINEQQKKNILLVCEDVTEAHLLSEEIAYQSSHDALTGLLNRSQFNVCIQKIMEETQKEPLEHALCYLDLDQFKVINDTCGHLAGDELLRQLTKLLRKQTRKNDFLARLGGDEFGILMNRCNLNQAYNACEKLRNKIRDFRFEWENKTFSIEVSIGISGISQDSKNAVDILKEADTACYYAKEKGRNRVHMFCPNDDDLASRQGQMQWVEKIKEGIKEDKFCLFGQIIIPIEKTDEGLHFETLIRYQNGKNNLTSPHIFLAAAERYNLASELDLWVIEHLFSWMSDKAEFLANLSLCSINLSGLSLSNENMQVCIINLFEKYRIPTDKICFEITETAAIENLSNATKFIRFFKKQGCSFSLDDFGSGLSSFAYLKNLPVDFLKIDGLFVKNILSDKVDLAMVRSINEVGHIMGKKTIAEFVENDEILACLGKLGVDYAQGYGIKKPVPLNDLLSE